MRQCRWRMMARDGRRPMARDGSWLGVGAKSDVVFFAFAFRLILARVTNAETGPDMARELRRLKDHGERDAIERARGGYFPGVAFERDSASYARFVTFVAWIAVIRFPDPIETVFRFRVFAYRPFR